MKLKTTIKKPARRDSTTYVSRYLNEIIDYGGIPTTRAEAMLHMQSLGATQAMIDRYLQGHELAQRRRERRERNLQVKLYHSHTRPQ